MTMQTTALPIIGAALLLLFLGDFFATFAYHVPQHVFGKFHAVVHHSSHRSFVRYAIRHRRPRVLVDGFLSALPYLAFIPWIWHLSPAGVGLGLVLAEAHVIWRHQFDATYRTPAPMQTLCTCLGITTPERHRQHHCHAHQAYGDIFAAFGPPARWWLHTLMRLKQSCGSGLGRRGEG